MMTILIIVVVGAMTIALFTDGASVTVPAEQGSRQMIEPPVVAGNVLGVLAVHGLDLSL
jgi:hypothetical protein